MTATDSLATPKIALLARFFRVLRSLCRLGIGTGLVLIILLMSTYLSRGFWLAPMLATKLAEFASEHAGGEWEIDALAGNWINGLRLSGVRARDADWGEFEADRIDLEFSLPALIWGELEGVTRLELHATSARLSPPSMASDADPDSPFDPAILDQFSIVLSQGARVDIDSFEIGRLGKTVGGKLTIELLRGKTHREARVRLGESHLALSLEGSHVSVRDLMIQDPGDFLSSLEVPTDIRAETLEGKLAGDLGRGELSGDLVLTGLQSDALQRNVGLPPALPGDGWLRFAIDQEGLRVFSLRLLTGGLEALAQDLNIPIGKAWPAQVLSQMTGKFAISIFDLSAFDAMLSPELLALMPISGKLSASVADGRLNIAGGNLQAKGLDLDLSSGSIALSEDLRGELNMDIQVTEAIRVPWLPELGLAGTAQAQLSGSLQDPRLQADLQVREASYGEFAVERVRGLVKLDQGTWTLDDLEAEGLSRHSSERGTNSLSGRAQLNPSAANELHFDLSATLESSWISTLDPRLAAALPDSQFAAHLAGSIQLDSLPLPIGEVRAGITGMGLASGEKLDLQASLISRGDGLVGIRSLEASGIGELEAEGQIPIDGSSAADLRIALEDFDLAWAEDLTQKPMVDGRARLDLQVSGPFNDLAAELALKIDVEDPLSALPQFQWPEALGLRPEGPLNFAIEASMAQGQVTTRELSLVMQDKPELLRVSGAGQVPISWQPMDGLSLQKEGANLQLKVRSGIPELQFQGDLDWLGDDLTLHARLSHDTSELEGKVLVAGFSTALESPEALANAALSGEMQAKAFDIGDLLQGWRALPLAEGRLDGTLKLAGTIAEPRPTMELRLEEGRFKFAGSSAIQDLTGEFAIDSNRIDLRRMTGNMGGGKFELSGTWSRAEDASILDLSQGLLSMNLEGSELLIVRQRGLKVRANGQLQIRGRPDELAVGGEVELESSKYTRRISLLPDLRMRKGQSLDRSEDWLDDIRLPAEIGDRIRYDITVRTRDPFEVRTGVLDTDIHANVQLRGTGTSPYLLGAVNSSQGTIRLPAVALNVDRLLLAFTQERPNHPTLLLSSTARRHGVELALLLEGPISDLAAHPSSNPPFPRDELVVFLTTGSLPQNLQRQGTKQHAQVVSTYLARELMDFYFGSDSTESRASLLERFSFESGREISEEGFQSLLVEFSMDDAFSLQAEQDIYQDLNMGLVYRIRF